MTNRDIGKEVTNKITGAVGRLKMFDNDERIAWVVYMVDWGAVNWRSSTSYPVEYKDLIVCNPGKK